MAFLGRNEATANPPSRRIFFWFLTCTFFMITSVIIFFSLGYRYDEIEDIFLYTGSINFKSEQSNIDLFIDGEVPSTRRLNFINGSYHLTGLRFGNHTIEARSEGYRPWKKDVRIQSGIATQFWNVVLIKDEYERTDYSVVNPQQLFFTPGNTLLAYPQNDENLDALYIPVLDVEDNVVLETYTIERARFAGGEEYAIDDQVQTEQGEGAVLESDDVSADGVVAIDQINVQQDVATPVTFSQNSTQNIEWDPEVRYIGVPIVTTQLQSTDLVDSSLDEDAVEGGVRELSGVAALESDGAVTVAQVNQEHGDQIGGERDEGGLEDEEAADETISADDVLADDTDLLTRSVHDFVIIDRSITEPVQRKISLSQMFNTYQASEQYDLDLERMRLSETEGAGGSEVPELAREAESATGPDTIADEKTDQVAEGGVTSEQKGDVIDDVANDDELGEVDQLRSPDSFLRSIRWHPKDKNHLLALYGEDLYLFDMTVRSKKPAEIFAQNVVSYEFSDDGLYVLKSNGNLLVSGSFDLQGDVTELATNILEKLNVDPSHTIRMVSYDNERIAIIDDETGSLSVYNLLGRANRTKDALPIIRTIIDEGVVDVQFSDDGKKLLYYTRNSIGVYFSREWIDQPYRAADTQKNLLDSEDVIETAKWVSTYEHYIAAIDNRLFFGELDHREGYNVEPFLTRNAVDANVVIDEQENTMYFTDNVMSDDGSSELKMQSIIFPYEKPGFF